MTHARTKPSAEMARAEAAFAKIAQGYPEATEDFPWGDHVFKVRGKIFVFLGADEGGFGLSVKLPESNALALALPFCEPTGYGLGKSGWVSARIGSAEDIDREMIASWIDESYRAIAPKKLVAQLASGTRAAPAPKKKAAAKAPEKDPVPKKKPAAKKKKPRRA